MEWREKREDWIDSRHSLEYCDAFQGKSIMEVEQSNESFEKKFVRIEFQRILTKTPAENTLLLRMDNFFPFFCFKISNCSVWNERHFNSFSAMAFVCFRQTCLLIGLLIFPNCWCDFVNYFGSPKHKVLTTVVSLPTNSFMLNKANRTSNASKRNAEIEWKNGQLKTLENTRSRD